MDDLWNKNGNKKAHDFMFSGRHKKGLVTDHLTKAKRDLMNRHLDGDLSAGELQLALKELTNNGEL